MTLAWAVATFAIAFGGSFSLQVWLLTSVLVICVIGVLAGQRDRLQDEARSHHEQALELAGRLIGVQEAERSRISRELHDDINQKLALVCITTSALRRMSEAEMREGIGKLKDQLVSLSDDVRRLSHDLHPDVIRHTGIVCALRSLCLEQYRCAGQRLELDMDEELPGLSGHASLCLYRVAQEAMHNAAKYAGQHTMKLTLHRTGDSVELTIADDGRGFDPGSRAANSHLGLISMEERVRLVGGKFSLVSTPGGGTTVTAKVPSPC